MPTVQDLFSLTNKTALVTGGTRGIGFSMTLALAEAGADIISIQRDLSNTTTQQSIQALGRTCTIIPGDISSHASVKSLTTEVLKVVPRVHILLNCAGIQARHDAAEFPDSDWNSVLQVNLTATFALCRDIGAHMLSQPPDPSGSRGRIINIASVLSFQGGIRVPAYAASKGGVTQLTKALSNEWAGQGVTVNAIAPGYVDTEMNSALMADEGRAEAILGRIPVGRWGRGEDFKGVVVWLGSAAGGYVSGEVVTVDGGWMGR